MLTLTFVIDIIFNGYIIVVPIDLLNLTDSYGYYVTDLIF